VIKSGAI